MNVNVYSGKYCFVGLEVGGWVGGWATLAGYVRLKFNTVMLLCYTPNYCPVKALCPFFVYTGKFYLHFYPLVHPPILVCD